jgi:hypothetical protein
MFAFNADDAIAEICRAATGAVLVQSDIRTADIPMTESVQEIAQSYFEKIFLLMMCEQSEVLRCSWPVLRLLPIKTSSGPNERCCSTLSMQISTITDSGGGQRSDSCPDQHCGDYHCKGQNKKVSSKPQS